VVAARLVDVAPRLRQAHDGHDLQEEQQVVEVASRTAHKLLQEQQVVVEVAAPQAHNLQEEQQMVEVAAAAPHQDPQAAVLAVPCMEPALVEPCVARHQDPQAAMVEVPCMESASAPVSPARAQPTNFLPIFADL
jgi:hypothetical protein